MTVNKRKGNYKGGVAKHYTEYSDFKAQFDFLLHNDCIIFFEQ